MEGKYVVEEVGFGSSVQQVSFYAPGAGTQIIRQFTGLGYDANRAAAQKLCAELNSAGAAPSAS